ncbi:mitochondrial carrier, partial [Lichtheimia hyalospora FSU 10163]
MSVSAFSKQQQHTASELYKYHFVAGATALSLSYSCMHPLDTIKTRIQADPNHSLRKVFTRETLRSLGKGFFVSALGAAGQGGARFSTYEFCKSQLVNENNKRYAIPATALSAVLGDLASSVIKVPREVVTAKLQTDHYASAVAGQRVSASYVIQQTLKEEGPRGLFKGFWAIAARDSPFMVILLVSYENFKAFHHRSVRRDWIQRMHQQHHVVAHAAFEEWEADIPTMRSILYGGVSGFLAGYFTTPMDVLRTRMITEKKRQAVSVVSVAQNMYRNAQGSPIRVYREFFAGAMPRSMWWFGICGIFFPTYETLKSVM